MLSSGCSTGIKNITYIGAFLSLRCNFRCPYCINRHGRFKPRAEITIGEWLSILEKLDPVDLRARMVPITLQGGEPTLYRGWMDLVLRLDDRFYLDLLTNLSFDVDGFIRRVPPSKFQRDVPYAPIRVSYHPGQQTSYNELLDKCSLLQEAGFRVGIFVVDHPLFAAQIPKWRELAEARRLDFRTKEFLGFYAGKVWGKYKYPASVLGKHKYLPRLVHCRTTELLISPDGTVHRCHRDLYAGENPHGQVGVFQPCWNFGECSECDVKIKNNRFQEMGSCSVEIELC